jgi:hypothetical protein
MQRKQYINDLHVNESVTAKMNYFETIVFDSFESETTNFKNKVRAFAASKCGSFANRRYEDYVKSITKFIWYDELERERIRQNEIAAITNLLSMNLMVEDREAIIADNGEILGWIDRRPDVSILSSVLNRIINLNSFNRNVPIHPLQVEKKYTITTIKYCKKSENKNSCKDCSICYEETEPSNFVRLNCEHEFCGICVKTIIDKNDKPSCAFCRTEIKTMHVYDNETDQLLSDYKK